MSIKIGNTELKYGIMLAPMAGFSDRAMRVVCHKWGAEYSVSEMISAKAVTYGDKKTIRLGGIRPDEGPVALQIFGSEPEIMAKAAKALSSGIDKEGYTVPVGIDINMGCPVNKIFSNGEGSALMADPVRIREIVRAVKENTTLPVSVKLRAGIDRERINAVECASAAEEGGADLICVHGRTRLQMYSGRVDRDVIKNVKKSLRIPVIANGDIQSGEDAVSMLEYTGADGVAVGRGAVGNPFIFEEIRCAISGEKFLPPTLSDRVESALWQLRLAVEDKGERCAIPEARKQIAMYLRSFHGAAALRAEINRAELYSDIEKVLRGIL